MPKLTKRAVEQAKPLDKKDLFLWDWSAPLGPDR